MLSSSRTFPFTFVLALTFLIALAPQADASANATAQVHRRQRHGHFLTAVSTSATNSLISLSSVTDSIQTTDVSSNAPTSKALSSSTNSGTTRSSSAIPPLENTTNQGSSTSNVKTGAIVGGAIGGLALLASIAICVRRKRQLKNTHIQSTRITKRGQLLDLDNEDIRSSEMSQEEGAANSIYRGGSDQELSGLHANPLVADSSLSGGISQYIPPGTRHADQGDPSAYLDPEMSIAKTDIPSSLSKTSSPSQPIQEDNRLRPTDNLSKTQPMTPVQVITESGASSDQRVSLIMQEVNELRAQMAVIRQQQLEASRESRRSYLLSEGDDSQTAPPSYSEEGL